MSQAVHATTSEQPSLACDAEQIGVVACITRDRIAALERALSSYAGNAQTHGRPLHFTVIDDSSAPDQPIRGALKTLSGTLGYSVTYSGRARRQWLAEQVARTSGAPLDVAEFALLGHRLFCVTTGAARNVAMLEVPDQKLLMIDDDTVCRTARPPAQRNAVGFVSDGYPLEVWTFESRDSAFGFVEFRDVDLLGVHSEYLGASVSDGPDRARVALTVSGVVGDCGWGSPGNYLLLRGDSLERFVSSEQHYRTASRSRYTVQAVEMPLISDLPNEVMTMAVGLDNRELLPPWLPVGRGQDLVFGRVLTLGVPTSRTAYIPWAVVHDPPETRSFWPGQIARASGIDLAFLMGAVLAGFDYGEGPGTCETRLTVAGAWMEDAASGSAAAFEDFARAQVRRNVEARIGRLESALQCRGFRPLYWARDVQAYIQALTTSSARTDFHVPVEAASAASGGDSKELTRELVRSFGRLLQWWPAITRSAREAGLHEL